MTVIDQKIVVQKCKSWSWRAN